MKSARDFTCTFTLRRYSETTQTADYTHGLWLYRLWKGWYYLYRSKTSYYFYLKLFSLFNKINNFGFVQSCDQSSNNTFRWNVTVECTAFLWNWRFPGLNSARRRAILNEDFRGFPQPIQANVGKASQIRARQFAFTFSLIHSSLISYHSTPYMVRLKYFVKETISNFQSVITAAYPQRQTRPAERKITKSIMKIQVFCDTAPCRLVKRHRRFEGALGLDFHGQSAQESTSKMRVQHSATLHRVLEPLRKIRLPATLKMSNHHRPYSQGMRGNELLTKLSQCSVWRTLVILTSRVLWRWKYW